MFYELWGEFISLHLCSVRQKRNFSSLQTILKHEEESIRDFTKRFRQAVQQIEFYSMDIVLQNFRRSFGLSNPFFHLLSLDPLATMEELYRWADRYSTLEDNIREVTQTVMITNQSLRKINRQEKIRPAKVKTETENDPETSPKKEESPRNSPP